MPKIKKCSVNVDNTISLCGGWSGTIGRTHDGRGGGFEIIDVWNNKTLKPKGQRIVAYSGEKNKNGVYINFCPWCGSSIFKHGEPA